MVCPGATCKPVSKGEGALVGGAADATGRGIVIAAAGVGATGGGFSTTFATEVWADSSVGLLCEMVEALCGLLPLLFTGTTGVAATKGTDTAVFATASAGFFTFIAPADLPAGALAAIFVSFITGDAPLAASVMPARDSNDDATLETALATGDFTETISFAGGVLVFFMEPFDFP